MGESSHKAETHNTQNQSNAMSDDPKDGDRLTEKPNPIRNTRVERAPDQDDQNQATIEEFGRGGLGVAPKE